MEKQQTALERLIDNLEYRMGQFPDDQTPSERGLFDGYINSYNAAKGLLVYERDQIIHAYDAGINNSTGDFDGEEYFNNRFKK